MLGFKSVVWDSCSASVWAVLVAQLMILKAELGSGIKGRNCFRHSQHGRPSLGMSDSQQQVCEQHCGPAHPPPRIPALPAQLLCPLVAELRNPNGIKNNPANKANSLQLVKIPEQMATDGAASLWGNSKRKPEIGITSGQIWISHRCCGTAPLESQGRDEKCGEGRLYCTQHELEMWIVV